LRTQPNSNSSTIDLHRSGREHHRSDRSLLAKPGNFHRRPLHRLGQCSSPVRPVEARKPQIHLTGLPSSKLTQTRNSGNTRQQQTHPDVHPRQNPQSLCTSQTGELHRSDRSGWAAQDEQHPRVNSPKCNSRSPESLHGFVQDFGDSRNTSWALHSQDLVHQNLLNQVESRKSDQECL
jgi:hypothetical protein